jgi:hypothetical protein
MAKTTKKRPTKTKIRTKAMKKPTPAQAALLRAQDPLPPVSPATSSITAIEEVPPVSSSIVRTTNASITMKEYGGLDDAFNHLNRVLFGGELPDAFINYTRKLHMNGHFAPDRYSGRVEEFKKPEIALNPDSFIGRSDEQIVSTLAHEMVHLKQECFGKPSKRGYHNKEWASMMKAIGLMPSNTGAVGGKETGQQMSHYIIPGGAYARAFADLAASGWKLNLESTVYAGGEKKKKDKTKYTCPSCGLNMWANIPDADISCNSCGCVMPAERPAVAADTGESPAIQSYDQQAAE